MLYDLEMEADYNNVGFTFIGEEFLSDNRTFASSIFKSLSLKRRALANSFLFVVSQKCIVQVIDSLCKTSNCSMLPLMALAGYGCQLLLH
jgi:hypothetical protein